LNSAEADDYYRPEAEAEADDYWERSQSVTKIEIFAYGLHLGLIA
jgi:hypothetical protein